MFVLAVAAAAVLTGCNDSNLAAKQFDESLTRIHTEQTFFKDAHGRYLYINGVNLADAKAGPAVYDPISFVGKPFPVEDLDKHFELIQKLGFNSVRFVLQWEAIEPNERGVYDEDYLDYLETAVAAAQRHGIYCLMDMHQDMFSRWLRKYYNDLSGVNGLRDPAEAQFAAAHGFNNSVNGDGAPEWVVQAALPWKNVGGPYWGLPYSMAPKPSETTDVLPWTSWYLNVGTSLDENICYAALIAGNDVWPNYRIGGQLIGDYLQDAYAGAFAQVAARMKNHDNILGYDVMNEPGGVFIVLTIFAVLWDLTGDAPGGLLTDDQVEQAFNQLLAQYQAAGMTAAEVQTYQTLFLDYNLLPHSRAEIQASGFMPTEPNSPYTPDLSTVINLDGNFGWQYLQPFNAKIAGAIQDADPNAIIFYEMTAGLLGNGGLGGQWVTPPTSLPGITQQVFEPHSYPDIYPWIGFNEPPRTFTVDEIRFINYTDTINSTTADATFGLGNPPVVLGEFGSYWNFGGIQQSIAQNYIISQFFIDPYYEAIEGLALPRMIWCYACGNTYDNGDGWNKEDFSIVDPHLNPRGWEAYSRAVPRFTSGRLQSLHFYSPRHYFQPRPGAQTPSLEFQMQMLGQETQAPTEIFVPPMQYTDGFYVWISDGQCAYDPARTILYWYPSNTDPNYTHQITIHPPYPHSAPTGWNYYFNGQQILVGVAS
jgi:hypothetical protein